MKLKTIVVSIVATSAFCLVSQAGITSATWWNANAEQLTSSDFTYQNSGLSMTGVQHSSDAQMAGLIQTDTPLDPSLTLASSVNNDTGNPWLGYTVKVAMSQPFTITAPSVNNPPGNDWFVAQTIAPTLQTSGTYNGKYLGELLFSEGSPVNVAGTLGWVYTINFGSSTDYSFTQEMIPSFVPIPEPGELALLGMGGVLLVWRLARKSR
jgi:hypothetical protein